MFHNPPNHHATRISPCRTSSPGRIPWTKPHSVMSKFGVLVMGPAGAGKTTFCSALLQHLATTRRPSLYINLDPAADALPQAPDVDIRDLITLDDAMSELGLGPNGALVFCLEHLLANPDFLADPLATLTDEYLAVIDMPGQIELYSHVPVVPRLCRELERELGMRLCGTYLVEAGFLLERGKYVAAVLATVSAMVAVEVSWVSVLSKMDTVRGVLPRREVRRMLEPSAGVLLGEEDGLMGDFGFGGGGGGGFGGYLGGKGEEDVAEGRNVVQGKSWDRLNRAVAGLVDEYSMVSFVELDVQREDSVAAVLSYIDDCVQFHEAQEPREPMDELVEG